MRKSQTQVRQPSNNASVNGHLRRNAAKKQRQKKAESPDSQRPPTKRQQAVLAFIQDFQTGHGYPPTIREIGIQIGVRSPNGVMCHLHALRNRGIIDWIPNLNRTLRIVSQPSPN